MFPLQIQNQSKSNGSYSKSQHLMIYFFFFVSNLYQLYVFLILTILGTKGLLQNDHRISAKCYVSHIPISSGCKLLLNHFLVVLAKYRALTSSGMWEVLTCASCWEKRVFPNKILAVIPEHFLVNWHLWFSTCGRASLSGGELRLGRHVFLGLSNTVLTLHEETSSDIFQGPPEILGWCCWCMLLSCQGGTGWRRGFVQKIMK